nr:hypothetical protein [Tanacetum cinerariifolium]
MKKVVAASKKNKPTCSEDFQDQQADQKVYFQKEWAGGAIYSGGASDSEENKKTTNKGSSCTSASKTDLLMKVPKV